MIHVSGVFFGDGEAPHHEIEGVVVEIWVVLGYLLQDFSISVSLQVKTDQPRGPQYRYCYSQRNIDVVIAW